jgi:uncharacterized Fe-S cluster protein YjdI
MDILRVNSHSKQVIELMSDEIKKYKGRQPIVSILFKTDICKHL